ncbi:uncharacterized protein LOC143084303 [Mytilus galloprovincialis]|uniref:uncharacterized protein LOC143084303 n=1 Tax=Mytilus galloprovincialis TaxID=29158 RepID=UPI003F7C6B14
MATIKRGPLTISVNIILIASIITKAFSFGFIMMGIYIKVGDDILEDDVIKVVNMQEISGMPLGTMVKAIVFSLIGVFVLELLTGVVGIWGAFGRRKQMLAITVLLRSLMIVIYSIYIVVLAALYNEKSKLRGTLMNYIHAYEAGSSYISSTYLYYTFPNFLSKLGCDGEQPGIYFCPAIYNEQLSSYLQIYFGLIVTCIICQCFIIVAVEYTYRKLEFKEKKSKITDNKYYLLFSLKHGILRTLLISAKDNWQRSKSAFLSVILKITSLIVGGGLLGLGLTLIGDNFIYDSSLKYIFYQIQIYNYYFYDILVGLAASSVVFGILAMVISIIGIVGSWRKSSGLLITSSVLSTILHVPRLFSIIVFSVLIQKIKDDMKDQLYIQQNGYYYNNTQNKLTENWNNMIMKLQCCGVFWFSDTSFSGIYEYQFCCKNADESRMDAGSYYTTSSNNLDYFGSCGGYKRDTCTGKIVFKTKMFIGWFLGIVSVQMIIEVVK